MWTKRPSVFALIMYADGDGVVKNDFEAFKIYSEIASQGVEPGSNDTGFFVNALKSLAGYYYNGIPQSPVHPDLATARQLYFQAASTFGDAEAQFRLAKMLLSGEGGEVNIKQAKKWLNHDEQQLAIERDLAVKNASGNRQRELDDLALGAVNHVLS